MSHQYSTMGLTAEAIAAAPYRRTRFGITGVNVSPQPDGTIHVTSQPALEPYPVRMSDKLLHWARETPDHTWMAKRGPDGAWRRISYAQALASARAIGQALLDAGLSAERPLMILSENDLEHALLALAAMLVGVPHAPVSPAYSVVSQDHEKLRHIVGLVTPGMVFAASGARYAKAINAVFGADVPVVVTEAPVPGRHCRMFSELMATGVTDAVDRAVEAVGPDTIVKFLFTSGSTSLPKAVVSTQKMWCSNLQMGLQSLPALGRTEAGPPVLVDWLPWTHVFGGSHNVGISLFSGGTLYIDDGKPVPALIGKTLENLREIAPTVYFNVPKGFEMIADALAADRDFRRHFFSRVGVMFYAGAGLSQPVWDSLHASAIDAYGEKVPIGTGLGMTETAPSALFTTREDVRSGHIGLPCPGVELKLVPSDGKYEARYRGPSVMPGYWRSPQANAAAFDEDGWFRSGDAIKWVDPADPVKGFLFDGRIAEDFKLATGTWVSVGPLRARCIAYGDPYVQDVVLTGINRDDAGALIFPQMDACRRLSGLPADASAEAVLASAPVRAWFVDLLTRMAAESTGSANRISRALLMAVPPSIERSEITDKGSINQRAVLTHRAALVESLYEDDDLPGLLQPR